MTTNGHLEGNYLPVSEEISAFDLPVRGELPVELCGRYLRNGPNPLAVADLAAQHYFSGDGMVHGVRLRDGRAEWYRNRYVGSTHASSVRRLPDIPGPNWNEGVRGPNTNVSGFAGTTWAWVEGGSCPVEMTYELETVGRNDFFGTLKPGAFTAHWKIDPTNGEMHGMVYVIPDWPGYIQYVVVAPDGRVRRAVEIPLEQNTMLHDMALTDRYAVVFDFPCRFGSANRKGRFAPLWCPGTGCRLGLLPREAHPDDIVWVDLPECFSFHPMNSFDDADGNVVIDLAVYDSMFDFLGRGPATSGQGRLERWTINVASRHVDIDVVDDRPYEFPRVPDALVSRPHRYGYGGNIDLGVVEWPTFKHDLVTGQAEIFDHGPGRAAGEPVFVPRQDGSAEDDGWLMMFVSDLITGASELALIDAQDFARGYVARVEMPQRVPFGFHGNWVGDDIVPPPTN